MKIPNLPWKKSKEEEAHPTLYSYQNEEPPYYGDQNQNYTYNAAAANNNPPDLDEDKKFLYPKIFLILLIILLQCVFAFPGKLKACNVFRVDTQGATTDDILGGIEFYSASEDATATATTSVRPTAATTITTFSTMAISSAVLEAAQEALENITQILDTIDDYVIYDDFSKARVFYVNDHLRLSTNGFECVSSHREKDAIKKTSASMNSCPANGFSRCFGYSYLKSQYSSLAYSAINTEYLITTTNLSTDTIDGMSTNWYTVLTATKKETTRLKLPHSAYKSLDRLTCGNDYTHTGYRGGTSQTHSSKPWALSLCAVVFCGLLLFFSYFRLASVVFWLASFATFIAQFGINANVAIPAAKDTNSKTEGLSASWNQGGLLGFFVPILICHLILGFLVLRDYYIARVQGNKWYR